MTSQTHPEPPSSDNLEIERKFLVDSENLPPQLDQFPHQPIRQGYIVSGGANEGEPGVRLRLKGDCCYITVKSGRGLSRTEHEGLIPRETFDALWPTTDSRQVEKVRYEIPGPDGMIFELDLYEGQLAGLITVEVEFASIDAAMQFQPPAWFGLDVTNNSRYNNSQLAIHGLPR